MYLGSLSLADPCMKVEALFSSYHGRYLEQVEGQADQIQVIRGAARAYQLQDLGWILQHSLAALACSPFTKAAREAKQLT